MNRRDTLKTIGIGALFGATVGTATATSGRGGNDSNAYLTVSVDCDVDNPARVRVTSNTGTIEIRDMDDEGVDAVNGRPVLEEGESYTKSGVPSGTAVYQAYDPDSGEKLGDELSVQIDCDGDGGSGNPGRVGNYNGDKTLVPPNLGGFDHVLLYLADGDPFPDWDRVAKAEFFNREIMDRSTEEIFEVRREAIDFHWERFGLDFPYPEAEDDLFAVVDSQGDIDATFAPGMLNPGTGYTAYVVSGKGMPNTYGDGTTNTDTNATGKVRDGSWGATLNEDATLGGTYGATGDSDVPAGTSVTFGDYSIRMGDNEEPIEIRFLSEHPIVRRGRVPSAFNCDLEHDEWGEGQVHGTLGGTMGTGLRNVLTFPPSLDS